MRGCQKLTLLVLLGAVVIVFWTLYQLLQGAMDLPASSPPSPLVLHTPTSTATATSTALPGETRKPADSPVPQPTETSTSTAAPSDTPTRTPIPPTRTSTPSPTATGTQPPSPTPAPQPTVPAEVADYLDRFVPLVVSVEEGILSDPASIDQNAADRLREIYHQLHEMPVPTDAEEMHLAFIMYVSVLEEKCLCHVFAEAHSADDQAPHFRACENRATTLATQILSSRLVPTRDAFLRSYSLTAKDVGFP